MLSYAVLGYNVRQQGRYDIILLMWEIEWWSTTQQPQRPGITPTPSPSHHLHRHLLRMRTKLTAKKLTGRRDPNRPIMTASRRNHMQREPFRPPKLASAWQEYYEVVSLYKSSHRDAS